MKSDPTSSQARLQSAYWQRVVRLTRWLLAIWFAVTFCTIFFARELSGITLFGWPLSFFLTAQGIVIIYLGIIGFYAWSMRRLDKQVKNNRSSNEP